MAEPTWSYILWFTQRVGSTLLTQALEDTGVAGRPREWLEAPSIDELLARHGAGDVFELRQALWRHGTANGVFAIKYAMTPRSHAELTELFRGLVDDGASERAAWEAMFPACRHVYMTRRDRVALAVSWWRAIQSGEWHRPVRSHTAFGSPAVTVTEPRYDAEAIAHLLTELDEREAAIHDAFTRWSIVPRTIVYENLAASYEPTVREVLRFLNAPEGTPVPPPSFARLADDVSKEWRERFVRERGPGATG